MILTRLKMFIQLTIQTSQVCVGLEGVIRSVSCSTNFMFLVAYAKLYSDEMGIRILLKY
jgi:hypothetical protein